MRFPIAFALAAQAILFQAAALRAQAAPIIGGQNNPQSQTTTPVLRKILEETGQFQLRRTVWPPDVQAAFEDHMKNGVGFVSYHAADNAFPNWTAYNLMIGFGGWMGRNEKSGPYRYFRDGKLVSDTMPGPAGRHGARLPFQITMRSTTHPIAKGLPRVWMHVADELYSRMRGPGENMTALGTAYSDPANHGRERDEPLLLVLTYGKGRIFHTMLGHDVAAMECVGFITTFARGAEWAATGKVTQKVPAGFPGPDAPGTRNLVSGTPQ